MINHSKNGTSHKFYGNYRAKVVNNIDEVHPNSGRVQVRVFDIHSDDILDEFLPWAIYTDPFFGGAPDVGSMLVPDIGTDVWVFFENGEHDQPVYFAGAPSKPHFPSERTTNYPKNRVFKTKAGFVIEIDDTEEQTRLRFYQPSGNELICDHDGNVNELVNGDVLKTVKGTGTLVVEGEFFKLKAPRIQLGQDDAVEQSVLGKKLEEWINDELVPWLNSHKHPGDNTIPLALFDVGTAAAGGAVWSQVNTNQ